ncbi:unnamed protein product, partial [Adineta steineri]
MYFILNQILKTKDQEKLRPWFKYLKLFLTALVKIPCAPAQTVWRGIRADISSEFKPRNDVIWWAFSSCTMTLPVLESNAYLGNTGARTLFSIEILNGRNIRSHSQFNKEDEILLLPGTCMEVQSKLPVQCGIPIVHLKQKVPDKTLLELPFKGAHLYPKQEPSWYRRKRFFVPISLLAVLAVVAVVLSAVFATRSSPIHSQNIT